jgi:putative glutamine amidotransferase
LTAPVIGLPTLAIPPGEKPPRFGINQAYVAALVGAGCAPVLIPLVEDDSLLRAIFERLDGIVFPGGADVGPVKYGEQPLPDINVVEPARDSTELRLARWAYEAGLPTLGICRGQQLLNVALGGTLYQDLLTQDATDIDHSDTDGRARSALVHTVALQPDSRLAQLIDETTVEVNSLHHQAIKSVAPALKVTGRSEDGVIEAVEADGAAFLIAVQWHPEELTDLAWVSRLFKGFARAAAR